MQTLWIDPDLPFLHGVQMRVSRLLGDTDDVLSLVILKKVQVLEGRDHVFFTNTCHLTNLTEGKNKITQHFHSLNTNTVDARYYEPSGGMGKGSLYR